VFFVQTKESSGSPKYILKKNARLSVQVGDLVRQKVNPQGVWLVTRISLDGNRFTAHGFGGNNTWLSIREYEIINKTGERL